MTGRRVLDIEKKGICDYLITVEFYRKWWFLPEKTWVQMYRGNYTWRAYPQGDEISPFHPIGDWLDTYIEQYEWSQEHAA